MNEGFSGCEGSVVGELEGSVEGRGRRWGGEGIAMSGSGAMSVGDCRYVAGIDVVGMSQLVAVTLSLSVDDTDDRVLAVRGLLRSIRSSLPSLSPSSPPRDE